MQDDDQDEVYSSDGNGEIDKEEKLIYTIANKRKMNHSPL